ncbi:MAG: hypothetical protein QFX33_00880 [Candidatus Nezhaarchaeota archaeon]|nr:hypothetical protein [Candidatus Nezhaarchaeota archaeon]
MLKPHAEKQGIGLERAEHVVHLSYEEVGFIDIIREKHYALRITLKRPAKGS